MKNDTTENFERLTRVRVSRRGQPVEFLVHYERARQNGCDTYQLFTCEEVTQVPVPIDSLA